MGTVDWIIVGAYCVAALAMGVWLSKRASRSTEDYFISGRSLPWWLAGTSMVATSFASDTPLAVTGWVRERGIWGNWIWWGLGLSTILSVFFFSRLWRRARVVTEVELTELRYSGRPAAGLRGFKSIYIGGLFSCYWLGAGVMIGLVKVMEVTTGLDKAQSIAICVSIAAIYSVMAGFWGVVATDFIQFLIAVVGALLLAGFALYEVGGLNSLVEKLEGSKSLDFFPPGPAEGEAFLLSPMAWFLGIVFFQWWAFKNSDGGGILIQRMSACRNEKEAVFATLWFNVAHYAIRSWPWILVALASIVLVSNDQLISNGRVDHEKAYPVMIMTLLPVGLKGILIASFFAAFMSTADTFMNWGSSYIVNDFYKRFVRKDADEKHYVRMSRVLSVVIVVGAVLAAWHSDSIGKAFRFILMAWAGIGVVNLARWFWWRVNAWSEISVMAASVVALLMKSDVTEWLKIPDRIGGAYNLPNMSYDLLYMVIATGVVWIPVTLLTRPVDDEKLVEFYRRARPPGPGWSRIRKLAPDAPPPSPIGRDLLLWIIAVASIFGMTLGLGQLLVGARVVGAVVLAVSVGLLYLIIDRVRKMEMETK